MSFIQIEIDFTTNVFIKGCYLHFTKYLRKFKLSYAYIKGNALFLIPNF